jgi:hypothetical protein
MSTRSSLDRASPCSPASDAKIILQLAEARTFGNGVVLLRYQRPDAQGRQTRDARAI